MRGRIPGALFVAMLALTGCTAGPASPAADGTEASQPSPAADVPATPLVDADGLLSAPIPSSCGHPAGDLVDGYLPGVPEEQGGAGLDYSVIDALHAGQSDSPMIAYGATEQAAVASAVQCSQGGVGWPTIIVVWDAEWNLAGFADLGEITGGGREHLETLETSADGFAATWVSQGYGDGACCGTVSASAVFGVDSTGALSVTELQVRRGEAEVRELIEKAASGESVDDTIASDQAIGAIARLIELGWAIEDDTVLCDGGERGAESGPWRSATWSQGPTCWAEADQGQVMFGLSFPEWGKYRVETAYAG